jgi:hypothetical protein
MSRYCIKTKKNVHLPYQTIEHSNLSTLILSNHKLQHTKSKWIRVVLPEMNAENLFSIFTL